MMDDQESQEVLADHEQNEIRRVPSRPVSLRSTSIQSEYYDAHSHEDDDEDPSNHHRRQLSRAQTERLENLQSKYWFTRFRQRCGDIVNHLYVQFAIIGLILVNAIMMGIATFSFVKDHDSVDRAFEITDQVFLSIFTVELIMQFIYRGYRLFLDGWLVFDFIIIVLSWGFDSVQVVRAFRIFRGFRLITRIKVLRDLVIAIGAVLPRMAAIAFLLMLVFYIFAVLFTTLFKEISPKFKSLDVSLFTCMEMMTLEWAGTAREVMAERSWAWAPFVSFIAISGFIVFNLIIAVVCDAVAIADAESAQLEKGHPQTTEEKLALAQLRINTLTTRIEHLHDTQMLMQGMVEKLAEQLNLPDDDDDGDEIPER